MAIPTISSIATGENPTPSAPSVWRNPVFLILLGTGAIMAFGNKIYELALPLILYDMTRSSVIMATMRGIEFLPNLLLAMFIGVLVDRVNKKRWSLSAIFLQAIVLGILYGVIEFGHPEPYAFYIAGFLLMGLGYAYNNARVAMVKHSLPEELLTSANASYTFVTTLVGILGPGISGLILMLPNLHFALLITSISFALAYATLLFIPNNESRTSGAQGQGFRTELRAGWAELLRNRPLLWMSVIVIFLNSASGMIDTTIIFYSKDVLKLNNLELGIVLSAAGVGGLAGSLLIGRLRRYFSVGRLISLSALMTALVQLLFYIADKAYVLALGLLLFGLFETISSVSIWTFRQETTPYSLIGRISGITGSVFKLGMPFAIAFSGWVTEHEGAQLVFLTGCFLNMAVFAACLTGPLWKAARA